MRTRQYGFLVDLSRCTGCSACELACAHRHPEAPKGFRHLKHFGDPQRRREIFLLSCNHCASPECLRVCPEGCYKKLRDGAVVLDSTRCRGCGRCVGACPFHVPQFDKTGRKVHKCDLCQDEQAAGRELICVAACPTGALKLVEKSEVPPEARQFTDETPIEHFTQPSRWFLPPKEPKCFWRKS